MTNKICPLLSRMIQEVWVDNQRTTGIEWADCQKENCQLWTKAEVRNEQLGIVAFESGCAIQLIARKGLGNYIHPDD